MVGFSDKLLGNCHFYETELAGADFTEVQIGWATFKSTDLSSIEGLNKANHRGPCFIDISTIYCSKGKIPEEFLRGSGVPEDFIVYAQSLVGKPIELYSCFISYTSKDHAFAERLQADLQNKGVRSWFAPENMKIGDRLRPQIDDTIRLYDKLLLILSKHSMASQWVEHEVETALARERQQGTTVLFPVRIDNTVMALETGWPALIRNTRNIGDFRRWKTYHAYQQAFARLLRDLTAASASRTPGA